MARSTPDWYAPRAPPPPSMRARTSLGAAETGVGLAVHGMWHARWTAHRDTQGALVLTPRPGPDAQHAAILVRREFSGECEATLVRLDPAHRCRVNDHVEVRVFAQQLRSVEIDHREAELTGPSQELDVLEPA